MGDDDGACLGGLCLKNVEFVLCLGKVKYANLGYSYFCSFLSAESGPVARVLGHIDPVRPQDSVQEMEKSMQSQVKEFPTISWRAFCGHT